MLEWLKRHAWKACVRQKCTAGSNPALSADNSLIINDLDYIYLHVGRKRRSEQRTMT